MAGELGRETKPETTIVADAPQLSFDNLREAFRYRDVLLAFAIRYVKIKYAQTWLGIGWAVVQPLAVAATLALLLGRVAHLSSEGVPFLAFALVGMVPWAFFSSAVTTALDSIVRDQGMLKKVYFPRELLPLATVAASLIDLAPGLAVLLGVVVIQLHVLGPAWFLLPLPLAVLVLLVAAVSLAVSAANIMFRDVRYAVPFVLQFGLVASPIAYSAQIITNRSAQIAYETFNPMAAIIDALRKLLLHDVAPDWPPFLAATAWTIVLLAAAYAYFRRLERRFADRM